MDLMGAASPSSTSLPVMPHSAALLDQALAGPAHVQPDVDFLSDDLWTFDRSNTESFLDETQLTGLPMEVLLPAHPDATSSHNTAEMSFPSFSLSYSPPCQPSRPSHRITKLDDSPISNSSDIFGPSYVFPDSHPPVLQVEPGCNTVLSGSAANPHLSFDEHPTPTPAPTIDERTSCANIVVFLDR
ncbi:uncharacterized protein F5891DRAFT_1186569 [Suillus fuscotomentosus]|uniref:Uncharacterized protein n=1 Tax=Suillus fuscotomentosus TaxID=1912939 RepID=A0AAD4HN03_9AGAM|nr:uncharacterized protein F5891DRAFT_1186569 [Suillus fuscotomentosus]KAG1902457.1 hypothetical protein F5891DRAFT_1186569 [Suillus fuscotomentosus]